MAHMARRLTDQGLEMMPFRQGTLSMNEPTKLTEKMILQKELQHGGNPVLRWMITNARTVQDNNGCVRIAKENKDSPRKVDGVVAMIMAIGQWMKFDIEDNSNKSIYEERGLRT
jgi:phage terminase large subunit-like protein